jgi:tRNA(His) 5'-end guanylyltransferase
MQDELGARMKAYYEDALRIRLPRGGYVVVRVDGRAFHSFTRGLERPYCRTLAGALDAAALALCAETIGCRFAYGQSDEYSFLLTDSEKGLWFDGNVQKICSVAASVFTGAFNKAFDFERPASFDARAMTIPRRDEAAKYFVWRQLDATANSLNMLASAHFSHEELLGKSTADKHEMLHGKGLNWAREPADFKRGRMVVRDGSGWRVDLEIPIFTREEAYLDRLLP